MRIKIHRGAHEIGGNCIEMATDRSRIILDIGMPIFNESRKPLDSSVLRRQTRDQLRKLTVIPDVPGLFDEKGTRPDAILLSHAHEDHTGLLHHSFDKIPIYASSGTSKMMLAGAKFAGQPRLPPDRHCEMRSGTTERIGDFTVTAFSVDHSIYGAQAFLIEAEGKSVLYSGDLRLHGRKPGMHRSLIKAVQNRAINVLLMEGTHIAHPDHPRVTEYELENEITSHIESSPDLVLASFSPQHVDRLVCFLRASIKANRIFVADTYTAFVMHLIASQTPVPRPESAKSIRVFFPEYFETSYQKKRLDGFYKRVSPARIRMEEIRSDPSRYVMMFRTSMLDSDFQGNFPDRSRCLYSQWTGYLESPAWQQVTSALVAGNGSLIKAHTSGHILFEDIVYFVKQINASTVIPIHTFEGARFSPFSPELTLLRDGEWFHVI